VAGIIGGEGILSAFTEGQAPNTLIISYDWNNYMNEMRDGKRERNMVISNHSWGYQAGWDYDDDTEVHTWSFDWLFGSYFSDNTTLDNLIRDEDLLMVKSAGNDRNEGYIGPWKTNSSDAEFQQTLQPSDPNYGSVSGLTTTKNTLAVGAVMHDGLMTGFSSWGPGAGGRLKPDVVAPGQGLRTTDLNDAYRTFGGTSASTPAVAGSAALLADYYRKRHNAFVGGLLLKALIIHSARDLGRPGPDYQYGHGIVDVELGARVIKKAVFSPDDWPGGKLPPRDHDAEIQSLIINQQISQNQTLNYRISLNENYQELRVTLVWFDPGNENLVNDLDVTARSVGGAIAYPWSLNASAPEANATRERNFVDTVERIDISNPASTDWIISVRGSRISQGPERFVLIVSASNGHRNDGIKEEGSMGPVAVITSSNSDSSALEERSVFLNGDSLFLYATVNVAENASYPGLQTDGSVLVEWSVSNIATGQEITAASATYELPTNESGRRWIVWPDEFEIPSGMPRGNYRVDVRFTMTNGQQKTATTTFSVQ